MRARTEVQYAGLIKEKDWLDLEKHSLIVLRSFLNDMAVADNRLIQIRTLEETNKANEAKAEARRQALADAQAKQEVCCTFIFMIAIFCNLLSHFSK
jgi:hypothetical protein